jgi:hypothetical protein
MVCKAGATLSEHPDPDIEDGFDGGLPVIVPNIPEELTQKHVDKWNASTVKDQISRT